MSATVSEAISRTPAHAAGVRTYLLRLHRWVGLAIAGFLIVSGITGSLIAFEHELDVWLNPRLYTVGTSGTALSPDVIAERLQARDHRVRVRYLDLAGEPGEARSAFLEPRLNPDSGKLYVLPYNQVYFDPATASVTGKRLYGAWRFDRVHLMPFIYVLHERLHLPGLWGQWLLGGVAMLWALDCFVGFVLTLPRGRPWLVRWRTAWRVEHRAGRARFNFDLHRAGGLWLWPCLLILAVSGIALNLEHEVFEPLVETLSPISPTIFDQRTMLSPSEANTTTFGFDDMVSRAAVEATARGLSGAVSGIFYGPEYSVFGVAIGALHGTGLGPSWLYFDAQSGMLVDTEQPWAGTAGDVFVALQLPLHSGRIVGLPGRILICLSGIVVATLALTGVFIWLRKQRRATARRRGALAIT